MVIETYYRPSYLYWTQVCDYGGCMFPHTAAAWLASRGPSQGRRDEGGMAREGPSGVARTELGCSGRAHPIHAQTFFNVVVWLLALFDIICKYLTYYSCTVKYGIYLAVVTLKLRWLLYLKQWIRRYFLRYDISLWISKSYIQNVSQKETAQKLTVVQLDPSTCY